MGGRRAAYTLIIICLMVVIIFYFRYNKETNLMEPSTVIFKKSSLSFLGRFCMFVATSLRLVNYEEFSKDDDVYIECTNFTVINYTLKVAGPSHEKTLTVILLSLQVKCFV